MSEKLPYTYTVLRYVHDVMTGEFVNVGVVMSAPSQRLLRVQTRRSIGRIRSVFPDLDRRAFAAAMGAVKRAFKKIEQDAGKSDLFAHAVDAAAFARKAIPADDSSLQWSPVGSGLTADAEQTFARLYERFVARYDAARAAHRRTDDDVRRPVRAKLEQRDLTRFLEEKAFHGPLDDIVFAHAHKNGRWHVYEPVSFDMADADGIKEKAREWYGHLATVTADNVAEPFKPHFIVGAPKDADLLPAYEAAVKILRRAPSEPEVYEEDQVDTLVAQIEDVVGAHVAHGN